MYSLLAWLWQLSLTLVPFPHPRFQHITQRMSLDCRCYAGSLQACERHSGQLCLNQKCWGQSPLAHLLPLKPFASQRLLCKLGWGGGVLQRGFCPYHCDLHGGQYLVTCVPKEVNSGHVFVITRN